MPTLMLTNQEVMEFEKDSYRIINNNLLPPFLRHDFKLEEFINWLNSRSLYTTRKGVELLSKQEKISPSNWNYASVSDGYWVREGGKKWEDVSLYRNFSNYIGEILLGSIPKDRKTLRSPEWTTTGLYYKAWVYDRGDIKLKKLDGFDKEYEAYKIAEELGVKCQQVELYNYYCMCRNFTSESISLIPYRYSGLKVNQIIEDFQIDFCNMVIFDYIIYNRDRHDENWGFLMDNLTGELICMAPMYDHNLSLWLNEEDEELASQVFIGKSLYEAAVKVIKMYNINLRNIELSNNECQVRYNKLLSISNKIRRS